MRKVFALLLLALLIAACGSQGVDDLDAVGNATTQADPAEGSRLQPTPTAELPAEESPTAGGEATVGAQPTPAAGATGEAGAGPTAEGTGEARKQYSSPPPMSINPNKQYTATIKTSLGEIVAELYPKEAPLSVNNFVFLAREGFYEGVIFHRIIPGFVIQGGDPDGTGSGGPGYGFQDEPVTRPYAPYSLAMAKSQLPNSNGSQFFVVLPGGEAMLEPVYNHFGQVTRGREVVDRIASVPTGAEDRPLEPPVIETIRIEER